MKISRIISALFLACASLLLAQNADPLIYTVGQSFATNSGTTTHNYILWQPGDASTTYGKRFAVYCKDGDASSGAPYARVSIQSQQTSPSAVRALLKLGELFDADAAMLPERVTALNTEALGQASPVPPPIPTEITIGVAQDLAQIMKIASGDPEVLQSLISLGRAHPGVMMSMGHGFAVKAPNNSTQTYEVREINGADNDIRVIGRVTLDASNPYKLLAPERPHPNPHPVEPSLQLNASGKDHLNVRLRWGMSDAFRETLPKTYGFNLYRLPRASTGSPETILTLLDLENADGTRVNQLPIAASDLFTDAEAADLTIKRDVFFYADDKNTPSDPFVDGEQFYYYVAARDIAGHPGPLSPPSLITMCDRLPPSQATILSVDNVFDFSTADPATGTGAQHLRIIINQVPESPVENSASKYRIYRWNSATDWQRHGADPEFNMIGEVDHVPGQDYVQFDDNLSDPDTDGLGPDTGSAMANSEADANMSQTFWYTVRSVDDVACDPKNFSGHSGAMYGVLRDRVGPPKPTGYIERCECLPQIDDINGPSTTARSEYSLDEDFIGFVVRVHRTEKNNPSNIIKKIRGFELQIGEYDKSLGFQLQYATTHYYRGCPPYGDIVVPYPTNIGEDAVVRVRSLLSDQVGSGWADHGLNIVESPSTGQIFLFEFEASVLRQCIRVSGGNGNLRTHDNSTGSGRYVGVCGVVDTNPQAREVRVYRRVGSTAPLQLISKTAGDSLPATVPFKENSPVLINGAFCTFFAQLLDEHGNASPLVRLGSVIILHNDLDTPMLTDPEPLPPLGSDGSVKLSWFCSPVGVERFEVWVADENGNEIELDALHLTNKLSTSTTPVLQTPDGDDLTCCIFQTSTIASGFGNGAEFEISTKVPAGRKLYYAIRAVGPMAESTTGFNRAEGPFSNMVCENYTIPDPPEQPVIPWPARPLPGVANINEPVDQYTFGLGPFYATAISPANMASNGCSAAILVGKFPSPRAEQGKSGKGLALFPTFKEPTEWLFNFRKQGGPGGNGTQIESINRFVVYRYQVASDRFQNARPNLVQVTPLIDKITHYPNPAGAHTLADDPFFIFHDYDVTSEPDLYVPTSGNFSRDPGSFSVGAAHTGLMYLSFPLGYQVPQNYDAKTMWIKDTLPVTRGAKYQYIIVHFSERGEIDRVIPTNVISH